MTKEIGKEGGPFGGCEPIGLTASGELVFPLDCKKLIKKPAEAPVAADDPATAEDRTASTDARPAVPSQSAAADKPAAADAKPAASETAAVTPAPAEPKPAAAADKPEAAHKAVSLDPAAAATSLKKPASTKASTNGASGKTKTMSGDKGAGNAASSRTAMSTAPSKPSSGKLVSGKTVVVAVKDPAPKAGQTEAPKAAGKDARPSAISAIKSMIVMAKPAAVATPVAARSQSEDRPRLRTAGMPACVQFRSYNPTTRSYRGFDGHTYSCR
ncbi:conserved hypothetical protein [Bradyrhizobium oligotrophicum S58]|uniref:Lectin-like protein BA14k n=1 Tax=Bradyrhizobium oligotrophicum S58 TaxID=1245469 RepID=M4ZA57_9BRAD|nr:conserved hypothetical protein [Bradyrhizobium oligotrophicum S58]